MSGRESWNSLQSRWAAGELLSAKDERRREQGATEDPLAAKELELFAELSSRLEQPDDVTPNVSLTLAGVRGVRLRVVGPDSADATVARSFSGRRVALAAGLGALAVAAAAVLVLRVDGDAKAPLVAAPVRTVPAPVPPARSRSELVFASGEVTVGGKNAVIGERTLPAGTEVATARGRACLMIDPTVDLCLDPRAAPCSKI